jgi:hypothetical protein
MSGHAKALILVCLIVAVSVPASLEVVYSLAHSQTLSAANAFWAGYGVDRLEMLSFRPSLHHGITIYWQMHFGKACENMPGDVAIWELYPWGNVEFTK